MFEEVTAREFESELEGMGPRRVAMVVGEITQKGERKLNYGSKMCGIALGETIQELVERKLTKESKGWKEETKRSRTLHNRGLSAKFDT